MGPFLRQLWTMSGVLFNMLGQGMVLSYSSSLMPALTADDAEIKTDLATASWIASSIGIAGIPGFLLSSILMDRLGRRMAHILVIIPGILGWLFIYFATTTTVLLIGRIFSGITAGASVVLGAVIIGEFTSPAHRGMILNLKTSVVCVGGMLIHIFGHFYNWRTVALISLVPCILGMLITMTWPESPAWLVSKGEFEKSEKAFYWLRGRNSRSENEINDMIRVQMERTKNIGKIIFREKVKGVLKKFTQKDFLKPMFIIFVSIILLEASGRHIFPAFALDIVGEIIGNKKKSFALTLALDLIITTSSIFSSGLIKIMKRRLLLFVTGFASVAFLAVGCMYLFLVSRNIISNSYPVAESMFVIFFILVNLGCTPMPLAFLGELLPLAHRGVGTAVSGFIMSLALNLGLQVTPFLLLHCKVYGTFTIFGGCIAVVLITLYFVLPETRDRTFLQEIEDYFNHGKFMDDIDKNDKEAMVTMISDTEIS